MKRCSLRKVGWLVVALAGCGARFEPGAPSFEETARISADVTGTSGTLVSTEWTFSGSGKYPEVMWANCTGTVLAPHAVMLAAHCLYGRGTTGTIMWNSTSFLFTKSHTSPYIASPFLPAWWVQLDNQQKANGGRQDDWPAMHDQALLFVPGLTQQVLNGMGFQLPSIDPNQLADRFTLVGAGLSSGSHRAFAETKFLPATPNAITNTLTRDGYLTRDTSTNGTSSADPGDSGGPTFGTRVVSLPRRIYPFGSKQVEIGRVLVGNTQDELNLAPTAYLPSMTPNQRSTVRLNSLWTAAVASDADGDGLPLPCDGAPGSSTNPTWVPLVCPDAVGVPLTATKSFPVGLLECKPGWVPTAIAGRAGWLIDQLRLRCQPLSCFETGNSASCESYWTDSFGGSGGGAFTQECPNDSVLTGIYGYEQPQQPINGLQIACGNFQQRRAGGTTTALAGTMVGATWMGSFFSRICSAGQVLTGFEARSTDIRWVTGLQPICSSEPFEQFTPYAGGQGGQASMLRCPPGTVATGTVQRSSGWVIDHFALICSPDSVVTSGSDPSFFDRFVVEAGFRDTNGVPYFSRVTSYTEYAETAPANAGTERYCMNGYTLAGVMTNAGALVDKIQWLSCAPFGGGNRLAVNVDVGGAGGSTALHSCPSGKVDGLFVRQGALLDGFALHCR